jgi:ATP-dependent Clp protease protease subunit
VKVLNLSVARGADGSKHLDIQIHGVIDGGWYDDDGVSTSEVIAEINRHLDAKTIGVRINSVGGSAFGGIAMYNALKAHPAEVKVYVEGLAASAASLIAMAGETLMGTGAMIMIHPPLTIAIGNASELRKTADVLDKIQSGIAAIYVEKTGKPLAEINAMISAETWLSADDAVAAGFANGHGSAPAVVEPATAEGDEDEEREDDDGTPTMTADAVVWNGVAFPIKALPQQQVVLAMAKPKAPPAPAPVLVGAPPARPLAAATPPTAAAELKITRALLAEKAPELLAELVAEGVAAERSRLKAIDELELRGCDDLVSAAKYGEKPTDAPTLAVAAIKAGKQAGAGLLEARARESKAAAQVKQTPPTNTTEDAEKAAAREIAEYANRRRGGK